MNTEIIEFLENNDFLYNDSEFGQPFYERSFLSNKIRYSIPGKDLSSYLWVTNKGEVKSYRNPSLECI